MQCLSRASQSREFCALPRNRKGRISTGNPGSENGSEVSGPPTAILFDPPPLIADGAIESTSTLSSIKGGRGSDSRPNRRPTLRPRLKPDPNAGGPTPSTPARVVDESGRSSSESEAERDPS